MKYETINFFDLGTYTGGELKLFISICESLKINKYKAYCFEPCRRIYNNLIAEFDDDNIILLNKAISDKNKVIKLYHDGKRGKGNSIFPTKTNVIESDYENVGAVIFSEWVLKNVPDFRKSFNIVRFNIEGAEWHLINDVINSGILKYIDLFGGSHLGADMPRIGELKDKVSEYYKLLENNNVKVEIFNESTRSSIASLIRESVSNG